VSEIEIRPLNPVFGIEVSGLAPKTPLDDQTLNKLRALFDEHSLLVFRDIDIDNEFQNYLSYALIGKEVPGPGEAGYKGPEHRSYISNREEAGIAPFGRLLYHSDMMWSDKPCQLLSLYGVSVEQPATPTVFVSAKEAWKTLPPALRARIGGRYAEHVHDNSYRRSGGDADVMTAKFDDDDKVRLPIEYHHPRTGESLLYICQQMTSAIADMPAADSEELLEELFQHLYDPANVFEHQWFEGDLVMWDNLALQHARPNVQAKGPARTLRKTFAPLPVMPKIKQPEFGLAGM
jgi:alpha-ketoglutarate-dependent taurine dioxygenase